MKKQKIAYRFKEDKDWTVEDIIHNFINIINIHIQLITF